jgi:hypothetical protein
MLEYCCTILRAVPLRQEKPADPHHLKARIVAVGSPCGGMRQNLKSRFSGSPSIVSCLWPRCRAGGQGPSSSSSSSTPTSCSQAISTPVVRFMLTVAKPAGANCARTGPCNMVRPRSIHSEVLLSRRYPQRFLVSGLAPKYLILLARPKRFELLTPRFVVWCSTIAR